MTNYLGRLDPDYKFTDEEFKAIPRYPNGDIIDLEDAYLFITPAQRASMGDDLVRIDDLEEEMRYIAAEEERYFAAESKA